MNTSLTRRGLIVSAAAIPVAFRLAPVARAEDDVDAVIHKAVDAMAALKSFHFEMETIDGKATILGALELKGVQGDVLRPASFQATIDAGAAIMDITVQVIAIDADIWVTNPLSANDWEYVSGAEGGDQAATVLTSLINPDRLFLLALKVLDDPKLNGTESIDGTNTTIVVGSFDPGKLADLFGDATATPTTLGDLGITPGDPVDLTFWIADDGKVLRIEEAGPLTSSESRDVLRRFTFSNFDEPVEITAPA